MKSKYRLDPRHLIPGKYFGQFQSIFSGLGTEMSDIRPYSPGDSAKTINWKTSAKHQTLYSNVYHQEKAITADILRDINYNRKGQVKGKYSTDLVQEVMRDLVCSAKTYGIRIRIFFTEYSGWLRKTPHLSEKTLGKKYDETLGLIAEMPQLVSTAKKCYSSQMSDFLERMQKDRSKRALIIFSDFLDLSEQDLQRLHYRKKEHAVLLIQLPIDPHWGQNYDMASLPDTNFDPLKGLGCIRL